MTVPAMANQGAEKNAAELSAEALASLMSSGELETVYAPLREAFLQARKSGKETEYSRKINSLLSDSATTPAAKRGILKLFATFGEPQDLSGIAACLSVQETCQPAIEILGRSKNPAAKEAMRAAWNGADASLRCSLLDGFALAKDFQDVAVHLDAADPVVSRAASLALAQFATSDALKILVKRSDPYALAVCINAFAETGRAEAAASAARTLYANSSAPLSCRTAAVRVLMLADASFFKEGLQNSSAVLRKAVIRQSWKVPVAELLSAMESAPSEDQGAFAAVFAARNEKTADAAVAKLLDSSDRDSVFAALKALRVIGSAADVPAVYALLTHGDAVSEAARVTLQNIPDAAAVAVLFRIAEKDSSVLAIIAMRNQASELPKFEPFLSSADIAVRKEAWKVLTKSASQKKFTAFAEWFKNIKQEEMYMAQAALNASAKCEDEKKRDATFDAIWKTGNAVSRRALAEIYAGFQSASALNNLSEAMKSGDGSLQAVALDSLSRWKSISPLPVLKGAVAALHDSSLKKKAFHFACGLITVEGGENIIPLLLDFFRAADRTEDRMTVAQAMCRAEGERAFLALQNLFKDASCGKAAKETYLALYKKMEALAPGECQKELGVSKWNATASHNPNEARKAFDRNQSTRWTSRAYSSKGMWYQLDLGENVLVAEVDLDTGTSKGDTPNGYEVYLSRDGKNWGSPAAKGDGSVRDVNVIVLNAPARYIKVVCTGNRKGLYWSIGDLRVKVGMSQAAMERIGKAARTL